MWSSTHTVVSDLPAEVLWSRLVGVAGWPDWNRSLASASIDGEFAVGATIRSLTKEGRSSASRVVAVDDGRSFDDRTELGDVQVGVRHEITQAGPHTVVTFRIEVSGEDAEQIGRALSVDLPTVLAHLVVVAAQEPTAR